MNKKATETSMDQERIRKQLHELFDLILDINGLESRQRKRTGDKPSAYFSFYGHVARVDLTIDPHGYEYSDEAHSERINLSGYCDSELFNLDELIAVLKKEKDSMSSTS